MIPAHRRKPRHRYTSVARRRRLRQELLERRDLLALDVAFDNGILDIRATEFEDIIVSADEASDGSLVVKINGLDPSSSPILSADVQQIQANGGLLSYIDLSFARENDAAFSSLRATVESAPDDGWLIDSVQVTDLLDEIYADPDAQTMGLSWGDKTERIYNWANARENFPRQDPWVEYIGDVELSPEEQAEIWDAIPFFPAARGRRDFRRWNRGYSDSRRAV